MIRGSTQPLTSIPTQRFCSIFSDCRYCIRQESPGQCGGSSPQPLGGPCSSCGCDCRWGGGFGEWSCRPMEGLEVMWLRPLLIWNDWHLSHWLTLHESISVVSWMMLNVVDQYFFSKKLKLPSRPAPACSTAVKLLHAAWWGLADSAAGQHSSPDGRALQWMRCAFCSSLTFALSLRWVCFFFLFILLADDLVTVAHTLKMPSPMSWANIPLVVW